jgi:hypothetical protein
MRETGERERKVRKKQEGRGGDERDRRERERKVRKIQEGRGGRG